MGGCAPLSIPGQSPRNQEEPSHENEPQEEEVALVAVGTLSPRLEERRRNEISGDDERRRVSSEKDGHVERRDVGVAEEEGEEEHSQPVNDYGDDYPQGAQQ